MADEKRKVKVVVAPKPNDEVTEMFNDLRKAVTDEIKCGMYSDYVSELIFKMKKSIDEIETEYRVMYTAYKESMPELEETPKP